ncbi:relaxase/mobilization nuclease domain-containing protein [Vreelandella massiliensis]|uniref:relaxase/mobilization nuclease domain-containing protein n=1 Tax=Vreelandella massiliensis TaxID=1816686 RepID=UPI00096A8094|nr:relaxase/mobilization nuclease domain-containing protein [Halomonas massiliensis]
MKAKVSRGSGFRGALSYLFDEGPKAVGNKNAEVVGGNMSGRTIWELSREFGVTRALRPDVKKPVWHASLSLPAGETLEAEGWNDISKAFLREMGFTERTPYTVIRHSDTNYDHVHILLSRIDLDATLWHGQWEARTAINATQKLEKDFGLRLTPGLGSARAERKKPSSQEINKAVRTGEQAPRSVIQQAIDDLLDGEAISALEFAEGLEVSGIGVKANIASTGRLNGFSFEYGGVHFKASQLGKAYGWKKLQERGVVYEQTRDSDGLQRFRTQSADKADQGAPAANGAEPVGDRGAPSGDSPASQRGSGTAGRVELGGDREARPDSADDARYDVSRDDDQSDSELREIDAAISQDDQRDSSTAPAEHSEPGGDRYGSLQADRGGQPAPGASAGGTPEVVEDAGLSGEQRASQRPSGGGTDWDSRFKQFSAAKRGRPEAGSTTGAGNTGGIRVAEGDLQSARTVDPTPYLESHGFRVRWEGKHGSVRDERGDEHYRLTRKHDGRILWCDLYGNDGGDSIALARELEPDLPFVEAVYRLLVGTGSTAPITRQQRQTPRPQQYPSMKLGGAQAVEAGRAYLRDRRLIDDDSIGYAEQSQMLRYDPDGRLLFAGYDDQGRARNVTRRAINKAETVQKRDLKGSDKSFPPILPGDDGAPVWIVEGGVDAIALHAEARTKGRQIPQIIVSGGSGVRSFIENPAVQQLLRDAPRVTIACDNEPNPANQPRTDADHAAQQQAVAAINPNVRLWHPPSQHKDIGKLREGNEIRRREAAEERAAEERLAATEAHVARMQAKPPRPRESEKAEKNADSVPSDRGRSVNWKKPTGPKGPGM